jgi:hypothetical protein
MQAALAAGCASILVRTGRQGQQLDALLAGLTAGAGGYTQVVADVSAAADLIVAGVYDQRLCGTSVE